MSGGGGEESGRVLGFDPVEDSLPGSWPDRLADNVRVRNMSKRCGSPTYPYIYGVRFADPFAEEG